MKNSAKKENEQAAIDEQKDQTIRSLPCIDEQTEVIRELRDLPPADYIFKIQNFTRLYNIAKPLNFESSDFKVAGYTWRLRLSQYPKGSTNLLNEKKYLSLYLRLSESSPLLPTHKEMNVFFKLFVYNQVEDKYLTLGRVRRFHGTNREWGFDELLELDVFKDESNGYLINDRCTFGAEIFVLNPNINPRKGESVIFVKELGDNTFTWNIRDFEKMKEESYNSEVFTIGGCKWSLLLYPNGDSVYADTKGNYLSFYLRLEDMKAVNPGDKLKVEYVLRVRDQLRGEHHESFVSFHHFTASGKSWGSSKFIPLDKLNDKSTRYITKGSVILQVEIFSLAVVKELA